MKNRYLLLLAVIGLLVCALVACNGEIDTSTDADTTSTADTTSEGSTATTAESTTTTPVSSTQETPDTQPDDSWKNKIEEGFYDTAVQEDGKYYLYLSFNKFIEGRAFAETYIADTGDILQGTTEAHRYLDCFVLRATEAEVEKYAKYEYTDRISVYPKDKIIDDYTVKTFEMTCLDMEEYMWNIAANKALANDEAQCPFLRIESVAQMEAFVAALVEETLSLPLYDIFILTEGCAVYDEAFFSEKSLLLVCSPSCSGSERITVSDIIADDSLTIVLREETPSEITMDITFKLMIIEINSSLVSNTDAIEATFKASGQGLVLPY